MAQLPREIFIEILSRCSIRSMMDWKLVCREWRDLIESREFAQMVPPHILEFPVISGVPCPTPVSRNYKIIGARDFNISIVRMGLSDSVPVVRSSVNGLILLLHRLPSNQQLLWVCNPITREYLTIPNPPHYIDYDFGYGFGYRQDHRSPYTTPDYGHYNFGFGVSRRSNEYKVVWISSQSEWHVFTLGAGTEWRTLSAGPTLGRYHRWNTDCAFLAGNLYWLDPDQSRIWCFDLETEVFNTFSTPPPPPQSYTRSLCVLKECLYLCDVWTLDDAWSLNRVLHRVVDTEIEVWLMNKELGGGEDWSKEYVIKGGFRNRFELPKVYPVRVLGDGTVLFGERGRPAIYQFINGVLHFVYRIGFEIRNWYPKASVFTPNFLPLKTLLKGMEEEVQSF